MATVKSFKAESLPWINAGIRKIINKKYKQLRKAQKSGNPGDWKRYKEVRNSVKQSFEKSGSRLLEEDVR